MAKEVLIVIPARGNSKGVPRKNLRPLGGKPLIYYSIRAALSSSSGKNVVVTTDDDEIALFAERFGAAVIRRPESLASDDVPLDPVVSHAVATWGETRSRTVNIVVTIQPTSPLIEPKYIDESVSVFDDPSVDTVLSVTEDRHLRWAVDGDGIRPMYQERVNRQWLPMVYRETGAIIACTSQQLGAGTRIGERIVPLVLPEEASVDIDSRSGFQACEARLRQMKILINVTGRVSTGLGHVYRGLLLASDLVQHDVSFLCATDDDLALNKISAANYSITTTPEESRWETVRSLAPDLVINDVLDTQDSDIRALKSAGIKVVNFEDLGSGADEAHLVFNALYSDQEQGAHVYTGPDVFCLRDEFIYSQLSAFRPSPTEILITFGGVDEANLTLRLLEILDVIQPEFGFKVTAVVGPGYSRKENLIAAGERRYLTVVFATNRISDYMRNADLAITSGGRTVFELVSLAVPSVVICQNERETTHTFPAENKGVKNLGIHSELSDDQLDKMLRSILTTEDLRRGMHEELLEINLRAGRSRVIGMITSLAVERGA